MNYQIARTGSRIAVRKLVNFSGRDRNHAEYRINGIAYECVKCPRRNAWFVTENYTFL